MNVAVIPHDVGALQIGLSNVEELQFAYCSWLIRWQVLVLWPAEDGIYADLLGSDVRQWNVLFGVAIIGAIGRRGRAMADVAVTTGAAG